MPVLHLLHIASPLIRTCWGAWWSCIAYMSPPAQIRWGPLQVTPPPCHSPAMGHHVPTMPEGVTDHTCCVALHATPLAQTHYTILLSGECRLILNLGPGECHTLAPMCQVDKWLWLYSIAWKCYYTHAPNFYPAQAESPSQPLQRI